LNKAALLLISIITLFALVGSVSAVTYLNYSRFDLYILEDEFYTNYQADLDIYFDNVEERLIYMENLTGWSSEETWGQKMRVEVSNNSAGCYGGMFRYSGDPVVQLVLSDPFPNIWCKNSYREDGAWKMGYPGPLGDYWGYVGTALHEMSHGINPKPLLYRKWLTEGWAEYHETNILTQYGDLNQESADYFIYTGTNYFNWLNYTNNDYRDTSPGNNEIQQSPGYSITAWMWTMLRDNYSLSWIDYYKSLMRNIEVLQYTDDTWGPENYTNYQSDMLIIDLFGKQLGLDMNPVFRYDGPAGPGWGVRNWPSTSWYPDLTSTLTFSNSTPNAGDTIDLIATVYNTGDAQLNNVSVKFYDGAVLIDEKLVDVAGKSNAIVTVTVNRSEGNYSFSIKVDEADLKLESDDTNNDDSAIVQFVVPPDSNPVASIIPSVTSGMVPLTVNFDGVVSNGNAPFVYAWDFDGNGVADSSNEDDSFTYNVPGNYTCQFNVSDVDGDFDIATVVIEVLTDNVPTASAVADTTSGLEPLTVNFDGTGTGGDAPLSYEWDFNNDGTVDSTNEDDSFTYSAGSHIAVFTVTDNDGDRDSFNISINVAGDTSPVASISTSTSSGQVPLNVIFNGGVTGGNAPYTYEWDFHNDGTIDATYEDYSYTYMSAGTYTAVFTVTDNDGDSDSENVTINVSPGPQPDLVITDFYLTNNNPRAGQDVPFYFVIKNIGSFSAANVQWELDSGSADWNNDNHLRPYTLIPGQEMVTNAGLVYTSPGTYTVTLTVDHIGVITESNEGNNVQSIDITVG